MTFLTSSQNYTRVNMKFDSSKVSNRNRFENDGLRVVNTGHNAVSQGDFNLKNGKWIIKMTHSGEGTNTVVGVSESYPNSDYNKNHKFTEVNSAYLYLNDGDFFVKGVKINKF